MKKVKMEKSGETIVKITQVEPNSEQPRKDFDEDALLRAGRFYQTVWRTSATY